MAMELLGKLVQFLNQEFVHNIEFNCSSHRALLATRISNYFGFIGPTRTIDTACSSSMYALDAAFTSIRMGECDAALVGGSNFCANPHVTRQFARSVAGQRKN